MAETLVALTITAVMTTIIIVQTSPGAAASRAATLRTSLRSLSDAVSKFKTPQSGSADEWPMFLRYLTTHPKRFRTTETVRNLCGGQLRYAYNEDSLHWRGPYLMTNTTGGVRVDQMLIQDSLGRDPVQPAVSDPNEEGDLIFFVSNVDQAVAAALESAHEGHKYDLSTGEVRWAPAVSGGVRGTLTFRVRIDGC